MSMTLKDKEVIRSFITKSGSQASEKLVIKDDSLVCLLTGEILFSYDETGNYILKYWTRKYPSPLIYDWWIEVSNYLEKDNKRIGKKKNVIPLTKYREIRDEEKKELKKLLVECYKLTDRRTPPSDRLLQKIWASGSIEEEKSKVRDVLVKLRRNY